MLETGPTDKLKKLCDVYPPKMPVDGLSWTRQGVFGLIILVLVC